MKTRLPELSRGTDRRVVDVEPLARAAGRWVSRACQAALMASYRINEHSGRLEMAWATPPDARYEGCVNRARRQGWWQPDEETGASRVRVISLV